MPRLSLNFLTALLVILTVTVQVGAIWAAADPLQDVDKPAPVETGENKASTAVPILLLVLAELVIVYGLWLVYQRLPELIQRWVKRLALAGGLAYALLYGLVIMPIILVAYAAIILAYVGGYRWLAYDIGALVLAIVIAATLGGYFGPVPIAVLVLALMVYDWVSVVETSVMERIVEMMADFKLPVIIVIPKRLDFDIGVYLRRLSNDGLDADASDAVHLAIGAGDFAIPAALAAAGFRFHGGAMAMAILFGTVIGLLFLLGARDDEALPGLPWLGGGAIGGYGLSLVVVMVLA